MWNNDILWTVLLEIFESGLQLYSRFFWESDKNVIIQQISSRLVYNQDVKLRIILFKMTRNIFSSGLAPDFWVKLTTSKEICRKSAAAGEQDAAEQSELMQNFYSLKVLFRDWLAIWYTAALFQQNFLGISTCFA